MRDEEIDILFFERPLVDLKRYAFKIAKFLKKMDSNIKLASISIELPENGSDTYMDFYFLRKDIKDIDSFLKKYHVRLIIFTNPRIPDMEMMLHAHYLGIKTIMIQEGVIFEGANINDVNVSNILRTLKFIPKTVSYFNILRKMCKYTDVSYWGLLKEIIHKKENITRIVAHYFNPYLIGDYVLTMGEHWSDYYINTMKYKKEQIKIMGDHDLDGFVVSSSCEDAICYIATVLVEDGVRTKGEFDEFLNAMANTIDRNTKLYIKLHPRSNENLYCILKNHNVEFIRNGKLPSTRIYIGHCSTMLARALYETDNLIIWKFKNENFNFFERFASNVCTNETELRMALDSLDIKGEKNKKRKVMEEIFWLNPNGAIFSAAKMIYQYMDKDFIE